MGTEEYPAHVRIGFMYCVSILSVVDVDSFNWLN